MVSDLFSFAAPPRLVINCHKFTSVYAVLAQIYAVLGILSHSGTITNTKFVHAYTYLANNPRRERQLVIIGAGVLDYAQRVRGAEDDGRE